VIDGEQAPDDRPVRARRGDARAYDSLVQEHQAIAFRTAYLITGSAADAEDAVQEAFVRAWLALRRFRRGAAFRPWLLAIVANEARNRVRSRRRRDGLAERAAREPAWQPPVAETATLRDGRLRAALATLPERDRSVLACRFVLDLGEQETAAVLGIAQGTVKSRTSRALDRLRAVLEPEEAP
jgi:RNA polymerase sigma-70 factor (ECF subfamily)